MRQDIAQHLAKWSMAQCGAVSGTSGIRCAAVAEFLSNTMFRQIPFAGVSAGNDQKLASGDAQSEYHNELYSLLLQTETDHPFAYVAFYSECKSNTASIEDAERIDDLWFLAASNKHEKRFKARAMRVFDTLCDAATDDISISVILQLRELSSVRPWYELMDSSIGEVRDACSVGKCVVLNHNNHPHGSGLDHLWGEEKQSATETSCSIGPRAGALSQTPSISGLLESSPACG
jgi:hypothetical protein